MASTNGYRQVKMVLVGDMAVGKTSLAHVFYNKNFRDKYSASVGGHFMAKTIESPKMTIQLWDTAGTERFRSMLPHFLRDALCAFVVYDVSFRESFMSVRDYWLEYLERFGEADLVKVLVGNKKDVDDHYRAVTQTEGANLAAENKMIFIETSAKFNLNVEQMFQDGAQRVMEIAPKVQDASYGFKLEPLGNSKPKKKLLPCC